MHKVSDSELYWAFANVARGLTPSRLAELRKRDDGTQRCLVEEMIDAIRSNGWEVLAFKMPLPLLAVDSNPNGGERAAALAEAGREVEKTTRAIIDAICTTTPASPDHLSHPRLPL